MNVEVVFKLGRIGIALAISGIAQQALAQQDFARSMAPVWRKIVPPETKCYFGALSGNAICEFEIVNGNEYDTLRLEAGQFDNPIRTRSVELTQTTTNRNSPGTARQMAIIGDFVQSRDFTREQLVSCMKAGLLQNPMAGLMPGPGAEVSNGKGFTMNCLANLFAPRRSGGTARVGIRPSKGPNEF